MDKNQLRDIICELIYGLDDATLSPKVKKSVINDCVCKMEEIEERKQAERKGFKERTA